MPQLFERLDGSSAIDSNLAFSSSIVDSNTSNLWLWVVTLALVDNDPRLLLLSDDVCVHGGLGGGCGRSSRKL